MSALKSNLPESSGSMGWWREGERERQKEGKGEGEKLREREREEGGVKESRTELSTLSWTLLHLSSVFFLL